MKTAKKTALVCAISTLSLLSPLSLLAIGSAPAYGQALLPLFKPVSTNPGKALPKIAASPFARRTAHVALEARALASGAEGKGSGSGSVAATLDFNLFGDTWFRAERQTLDWKSEGRFNWIGTVADDPGSQVLLVSREGALTGTLTAHGRVFEILPDGNGNQIISELDPGAYEAVERAHPDDTEGPTVEEPAFDAAIGDSLVEIDVLVLYEPTVATKAGDIEAFVESLILASNEAYSRSLIPQKIRLVHHQAMSVGSTSSTAYSWLRSSTEVAKIRDQYGADLVTMLVESSSACGTGSVNGAFSTVKRTCALGGRSFTHELGHNMGALHNREEEGGNPSGYNYGYIDYSANWRTIMAYATNCSCPRINNLSNPSVKHNNAPTGVADKSDNARMLRSKSLTVSKWRARKVVGGTDGNNLVVVKTGAGKVVSDVPGINCGIDCDETFAVGTSQSVRLSATADSGWIFKGWEGDCSGTGACIVTMAAAKQVVARFENPNFITLSLWDINGNRALQILNDSGSFLIDSLPTRFSIEGKTAAKVGSVRFELEGPQERERVENIPPYGLFGDSQGAFAPWSPAPTPGKYVVTFTAFSEASGGGDEVATKQFFMELKKGSVLNVNAREASEFQPKVRRVSFGIELELSASEHLSMHILTLDGRKFNVGRGLFKAGSHLIALPEGLLGKGVHHLHLIGSGKSAVRKIAVVD